MVCNRSDPAIPPISYGSKVLQFNWFRVVKTGQFFPQDKSSRVVQMDRSTLYNHKAAHQRSSRSGTEHSFWLNQLSCNLKPYHKLGALTIGGICPPATQEQCLHHTAVTQSAVSHVICSPPHQVMTSQGSGHVWDTQQKSNLYHGHPQYISVSGGPLHLWDVGRGWMHTQRYLCMK